MSTTQAGPPRAMLLDLDDTILDDSSAAAECWQLVCTAFAPQLPGLEIASLIEAIERGRATYWADKLSEQHRRGRLDLDASRAEIIGEALRGLDREDAELALEIAIAYAGLRFERMTPLPGAIETVQRLRADGIRLALLTNGAAAPQRRKIERYDLAPHFDCIVIEGEFGHGKPHESTYRHALAALGVAPDETWMVGDNLEWDVAAPQRLGVRGIWIDAAGAGLPAGSPIRPFRIIRSLAELDWH